jgi:ribosome biogenesis protein UTP30
LRICLITADPQRAVKNLVADPTFPDDLKSRIAQIIGLTKLKERYKTFETRRQLVAEHDIFLADDRIINRLPAVLGKVFYKGTSKRPIPIIIAQSERKQEASQQGKKAKKEPSTTLKRPLALAKEIEKAIDCVPVSLRPGTSLAVRAGLASFEPQQLVDNISAVVTSVIEKHVVKGWRNVKSIHIKGNLSTAVPIWLADDLWTDSADITATVAAAEDEDEDEQQGQKRKRNPATTKGPQAGSRKKTKVEEAKEARSEADRAMGTTRKNKLAAQKAKIFAEPV